MTKNKKTDSEIMAFRILTKDTCYGMYDQKVPSNEELAKYFSSWIDDYAKTYHVIQTEKDNIAKAKALEKTINWWTKEEN